MKRILSILLAVLMAFTTIMGAAMLLPGSIEASTSESTFKGSFNAKGGDVVTVSVKISENPGILGASLKLNYDSGLTITDSKSGDAFSALTLTKPGKYTDGCKFVWDGIEISKSDIKTGTILELTFNVSTAITSVEKFNFSFSYEDGDVVDTNLLSVSPQLTFDIVGGSTVEDPTQPTDPDDPVVPDVPSEPEEPSENNTYTGTFTASTNDEIIVKVQLKNNPGILGAVLTLNYDEGLNLISAQNGEAFSPLVLTSPGILKTGCKFVWDGVDLTPSDIKNGDVLILKFKAVQMSVGNNQYSISVSYKQGDIVNANLEEITPVFSFEIPTGHTHSFSSTWKYDDTYHWHECSGCSEISGKSVHQYDNDRDTTCNVCGAVREVEPEVVNLKISVDNKKVVAGDTFKVDMNIGENLGFAYLELSPNFSSCLTLQKVENGNIISDFTNLDGSNKYIWLNEENVTKTGTLATFTFKVNDSAETGDYNIGFIVRNCATADEKIVAATIDGGKVTVIDFVYGDANGDGKVDGLDLIRLKRYVAYYNYDTNTSSIEVGAGADANGDGKVDGLDLIRLKRYIAYYNYETGKSTVELGPQG